MVGVVGGGLSFEALVGGAGVKPGFVALKDIRKSRPELRQKGSVFPIKFEGGHVNLGGG